MVFSSIPFLFRFLPIFLIMYFAAPRRMRNLVLFLGSLIFYAWGEPVYVFLMLFSTVSDYVHGIWIGKFKEQGKEKRAKAALASSIIINLAMLCFFKYAEILPLPVGISFYTFQTMSYTIDVYRLETKPQRNFVAFGVYVSMFPQLIAGPIIKYKQAATGLTERRETFDQAAYGIRRFVVGLGKKVLLANQAGLIWEQISAINPQALSMSGAWLGMLAFAFQIYFDFSGYSDMAIGLGAMFGFTFPENFHYPYLSLSITQFWRRWHMTLGGWFRDYVYIPLGGSRRGLGRQLINILIVWLLTGIWHGAGWNFLVWGLWFAVFLVLEKFIYSCFHNRENSSRKENGQNTEHTKRKNPLTTVFLFTYSFTVVLAGWVFFSHENIVDALAYLKVMFFWNRNAVQTMKETIYFLLYNYRVLLFVLLIGATPFPAKAAEKIKIMFEKKRAGAVWTILELLFLMGVFLLSTAFIVDASYNPFLYFRF
ncbi:MAG: MBOAT family protein [Clostridiales bacterium]|nr:MBOAT family protein [Clostridiales bacterium]